MTDIVERLRDLADPNKPHEVGKLWDGLDEGADEIERLRAAIAVQGAEIDRICNLWSADKAEIEQLKAALDRHQVVLDESIDAIVKRDAEIERLRAELKDTEMWEAHLKNEIEQLKAGCR